MPQAGGESGDRRVVIVGAGPAGLAAAASLVDRGISPLIIESDTTVGGIAKTLNYKGNRIDLGGHRFFTHNEKIRTWWESFLPMQGAPSPDDVELGRPTILSEEPGAPDPETTDRVMLSRARLSHIYYLRKFFDYPVSLSWPTLSNLGFARTLRIGVGYFLARLTPIRPELTLEEFMVNRFGRPLYEMFFRDYTEKLWGVPCNDIGADWGAQRIKGISVGAAIRHALTAPFARRGADQSGVQTSLIGRFSYPKLGPGQLWEAVADHVVERGAQLLLSTEVVAVNHVGQRVVSVTVRDVGAEAGSAEREIPCDALMSTMPIRDLIRATRGVEVPPNVARVADGLPYRDFMTCGLLVRELTRKSDDGGQILDNWIYIQEPEVEIGRLQIFNNWSPYMVADRSLVWLGTEYFCDEGDELWNMPDQEFSALATAELTEIGLISAEDVLDSVVIRVKKAYPAYFGTYDEMGEVRDWLDSIENLYVMGRNGTHRYNNMDHSVLSAWTAVSALLGEATRSDVWRVNTDESYHE